MIINFSPSFSFNKNINKPYLERKPTQYLSQNKNLINPNFKGLSKDLGKKLYEDATTISQASYKHPKSQGVAGNLPPSWIQNIPKSERKEKINKLYSDMSRIPDILRKGEFSDRAAKKASKKLTKALIEASIIDKKTKLELKKLGRGSAGYGYLIEGMPTGEKFVIKIYHSFDPNNRQTGPNIEINRAIYWKKNAGSNNQRVKFYFGDIDSGYMVTKFVDENTKPPKKFVNPLLLGIIPRDDGSNKIAGHHIDYGYLDKYGITVAKDRIIELQGILSENKDARFAFRRIYNCENKEECWNELTKDNKFKNKTGIKIGLTLALDLIDTPGEKYAELYKESKKISNKNEYYTFKKALAQKIEHAPQDKIQEYCKELIMCGEEIMSILKTKTYYIKDPGIKNEIEKTIDDYYKIFRPSPYPFY